MVTKFGNVLSWASIIEDNTIEQAQQAANLPFVTGHLALMSDAHVGFGSTVGSVIPTQGAIIPGAVGVDIGCGMLGVLTDLTEADLPDNLGALHSNIARSVPAGVNQGFKTARDIPMPPYFSHKESDRAAKQYGSLGSGNHFVEVCIDQKNMVWVVLHSGSRGIGNMLAKKHIEGAKKLMKKYFITLDDPDLAYLVQGTPEFDAYIADMLWAQDYAMGNREVMMDAVLNQLFRAVGKGSESNRINCHHNFTAMEHHRGKNLWITRKGAIKAGVGDYGIIPGSMGTATYIVEGKGNEASYCSCSHGAGRILSRSAARQKLTVESLNQAMKDKTWNSASAGQLVDEHPEAYKSIDTVMHDQADLVTIVAELRQVLNYKGV